MKKKDHKALARYLLERAQGQDVWQKRWHRRFFLYGCVSPDYLPHTYLRGFRQSHAMLGHHARYSQKKICRMIDRLQRRDIRSLRDCFRLGTLMHYLSDSFTFSHTDGFAGDMKAHRRYEKGLHACFTSYLHAVNERLAQDDSTECERDDWLMRRRLAYESDAGGMERDCHYILRSCDDLFCRLCRI